MTEKRAIAYRLLGLSRGYKALQRLLARRDARARTAAMFAVPEGARVLDLGCGPADILHSLPESIRYTGMDSNADYLDQARREHGARGNFILADVSELDRHEGLYDCVMAIGLLHHLDDDQCRRLVAAAERLLDDGGKFIAFDGCYTPRQNPIAQFLLRRDRGNHVRSEEGYVGLARSAFPEIRTLLTKDLLRLPYTHIVMTCRR